MKTAFIYARVSTEEQAEEGKSIQTQEILSRKWAKENGYSIQGLFVDEGKSATSLNRPALQEMLAKCQDKGIVEAIIVQDTDRLSRNTLDHLTIKSILKKKGIRIVSISQPMIDDSPEGNLIDTIIASVNAFQSQITGRKTSKVLEEKAKLGWYPGGLPPLGYLNSSNPSPTGTLDEKIVTINRDTAPLIRRMFEMYASGDTTMQDLVKFAEKRGITSPSGRKLGKSSVQWMLKNSFYIGLFQWNGKFYKGKHEQFISEDLFQKVQEMITLANRRANRKRKHSFLLSGFVYDADTLVRMWAEKHIKKTGKEYSFYFSPDNKKDSYIRIFIK